MPTALLLLAQTGFGSPVGKVIVLFGLLASLVLIARWWWQNRGR
ncbi:hypothetical protein [Pseudonocardia sp. TRM90224]|nr:hypothetical protein [Pseudonocardia sp. TRM90224]